MCHMHSLAAMPDVMSGRGTFMFENLPSAAAGASRQSQRWPRPAHGSPSAPDLPTLAEAGFPDFAIEGWFGLRVGVDRGLSVGTLWPTSSRRSKPVIRRMLEGPGFIPIGVSPEAFAERQKADLAF